jgi:hypothetical protein
MPSGPYKYLKIQLFAEWHRRCFCSILIAGPPNNNDRVEPKRRGQKHEFVQPEIQFFTNRFRRSPLTIGTLIGGPHSLQNALSGGNEAECVRSERHESRC